MDYVERIIKKLRNRFITKLLIGSFNLTGLILSNLIQFMTSDFLLSFRGQVNSNIEVFDKEIELRRKVTF